MSAKTLDAYRRDVAQFLGFLAGHLGGAPTLKQLARLVPADVRAFMAARRSDGSGNPLLDAHTGRHGCRSFARFLERNGKGKKLRPRRPSSTSEICRGLCPNRWRLPPPCR